ncbi:12246_t:CDS:2 [Entrophospora sp. SA101]|nr:12246_t:CDS:2 [Entrophospora sp. SA101]
MPNDNKKTKNKAKKIKEKVEEKSSELENEVRKTASKMSSDSSNTADEITNLKKEIETLKEKNLRLLADLDNQRKNYLKEISEMLEFNNKRLIGKLLLFFDSYERAIQISQAYQDPKVEQFLTGFQMTLAEVQNDFFKKEGVEEIKINLQKDTYDSKLHHALEVEENNDYPEGTILQVFQKGYRLRQQVLRRAEVKISKKNKDFKEDDSQYQEFQKLYQNLKDAVETRNYEQIKEQLKNIEEL